MGKAKKIKRKSFRNKPFKIATRDHLAEYLGSVVGSPKTRRQIFVPKIEKIERSVRTWKNCYLTLYGKKLVINAILGPKIYYRAHVEYIDMFTLNKLCNIWKGFIWQGRPKIAWNTLVRPPEELGLGLACPKVTTQAGYAKWIRDFFAPKNEKLTWVKMFKTHIISFCKKHGVANPLFFSTYGTKKQLPEEGNLVYACMLAYGRLKKINAEPKWDVERVKNQGIWWNFQIHSNGKPFYIENAHKKGIVSIKHILGKNGCILTMGELSSKFKITNGNAKKIYEAIPFSWKIILGSREKIKKLPQISQKSIHISYRDITTELGKCTQKYLAKCIRDNMYPNKDTKETLKRKSELSKAFRLRFLGPKARDFWFKSRNSALSLNSQLCKFVPGITEKCSFCNTEKETFTHFKECDKLKSTRRKISLWADIASNPPLWNLEMKHKNVSEGAYHLVALSQFLIFKERTNGEININKLIKILRKSVEIWLKLLPGDKTLKRFWKNTNRMKR